MKILEIREILRLIDQSTLNELEIKIKDHRILIKKDSMSNVHCEPVESPSIQTDFTSSLPNVSVTEDVESTELHIIQSQFIGTFQPKVKVGDQINENKLIAQCRVGGLDISHDIYSDINGEIVEVLYDIGDLIDYGQPLFKISGKKGAM